MQMAEYQANDSRLLLVDDDPSFNDALARALERRGFSVDRALDVNSAMTLATQNMPQYALVDLRIGDDSGLPLVEYLASLSGDISIVILTGYASISTAVEAIKLGARQYLTKPTDPDEIIAAFERETGNAEVNPNTRPMSVARLEWEHIQQVLHTHKGNISAAARALGMHRRTLQRKLQKRPRRN